MFDLEVPFHRLVHHFVFRAFHGAGEGDELQFGIPALLGLLSTPAAFGSIALLNKYSTLSLFLLHRQFFDVYRASIPDEYFFVVYSMVVTGTVVILKWDRLFPDRQDYDNLAALPISLRQIFLSNLIAILFLASIFAVDINAAACVIFPWAVTSRYDTFAAYFPFFLAHASAVLVSSFFVCFGLLSVMGLTLLLVPRNWIRAVSLALRVLLAVALVAILGSAFSVPRLLLSPEVPAWAPYLPPVWFLDLHQAILGRGAPFGGSSTLGLAATIFVFVLALVTYALTYYRQFARIAEQTAVHPAFGRDRHSALERLLDRLVLRTPFQRATYHFALKTLFRSERHCLLFGGAIGIGFFLAAQALSDAMAAPAPYGIDSRLLSVSLTLSYFIVCSLRALYDLPTDLRSNWIFQSIVDRKGHESRPVGMKIMISLIVPWLLVIGLPLHAAAWGWRIALLHTGYVLLWSAALAEFLLAGFRKIPFTCMHTVSKDRVLVVIIFVILGYWFFGPANSVLEPILLERPARLLVPLGLFLALLKGIHAAERDLPEAERILTFEDRPPSQLQLLDLSR